MFCLSNFALNLSKEQAMSYKTGCRMQSVIWGLKASGLPRLSSKRSFLQLSLQERTQRKTQQHCWAMRNSSMLKRPIPPDSTGVTRRAELKLIFPLQNLSSNSCVLRSVLFDGILKQPKWESGQISRLFVTHILPGSERLNRFQNSTFFTIPSRIRTKLPFQSSGFLESSMPRTLILSEKANPRAAISSGISCEEPINKIAVLSRLHLRPLITANSERIIFKFRRF